MLTENEHYIVANEIFSWCQQNGCHLVYYRKLKNGHIPMIREVKIASETNLGKFKSFMKQYKDYIIDHTK